jgi:hypothetical protein
MLITFVNRNESRQSLPATPHSKLVEGTLLAEFPIPVVGVGDGAGGAGGS